MSKNIRVLIGALTLSAAALVGIFEREGYTNNTIIPTKGDVPTNGFGSTVKEDGSRVQMSFAKVKQEYTVQNQQGGSGGAVTAGYDIKLNKEA